MRANRPLRGLLNLFRGPAPYCRLRHPGILASQAALAMPSPLPGLHRPARLITPAPGPRPIQSTPAPGTTCKLVRRDPAAAPAPARRRSLLTALHAPVRWRSDASLLDAAFLYSARRSPAEPRPSSESICAGTSLLLSLSAASHCVALGRRRTPVSSTRDMTKEKSRYGGPDEGRARRRACISNKVSEKTRRGSRDDGVRREDEKMRTKMP